MSIKGVGRITGPFGSAVFTKAVGTVIYTPESSYSDMSEYLVEFNKIVNIKQGGPKFARFPNDMQFQAMSLLGKTVECKIMASSDYTQCFGDQQEVEATVAFAGAPLAAETAVVVEAERIGFLDSILSRYFH